MSQAAVSTIAHQIELSIAPSATSNSSAFASEARIEEPR